jgi:molybdenum-dependent DNA-binding transcriptional regulator ModE
LVEKLLGDKGGGGARLTEAGEKQLLTFAKSKNGLRILLNRNLKFKILTFIINSILLYDYP